MENTEKQMEKLIEEIKNMDSIPSNLILQARKLTNTYKYLQIQDQVEKC